MPKVFSNFSQDSIKPNNFRDGDISPEMLNLKLIDINKFKFNNNKTNK